MAQPLTGPGEQEASLWEQHPPQQRLKTSHKGPASQAIHLRAGLRPEKPALPQPSGAAVVVPASIQNHLNYLYIQKPSDQNGGMTRMTSGYDCDSQSV